MKKLPVVLASGSPRRIEILRDLKLRFDTVPSTVDEKIIAGEDAETAARRLALLKGNEVAGKRPDALVIAADTIVSLDGELIGKPADENDARRILNRLNGKTHEVITGLAFILKNENFEKTVISKTEVTFEDLSPEQIDEYLATGEYAGKAGAYAIQGEGADLISGVDGSFSNVIGLPITDFNRFVIDFGAERFPFE